MEVSTAENSPVKPVVNSELSDTSSMWTDFNVSEMLPDLNISEWFNEKVSSFDTRAC